jgi:hypothetical protein
MGGAELAMTCCSVSSSNRLNRSTSSSSTWKDPSKSLGFFTVGAIRIGDVMISRSLDVIFWNVTEAGELQVEKEEEEGLVVWIVWFINVGSFARDCIIVVCIIIIIKKERTKFVRFKRRFDLI